MSCRPQALTTLTVLSHQASPPCGLRAPRPREARTATTIRTSERSCHVPRPTSRRRVDERCRLRPCNLIREMKDGVNAEALRLPTSLQAPASISHWPAPRPRPPTGRALRTARWRPTTSARSRSRAPIGPARTAATSNRMAVAEPSKTMYAKRPAGTLGRPEAPRPRPQPASDNTAVSARRMFRSECCNLYRRCSGPHLERAYETPGATPPPFTVSSWLLHPRRGDATSGSRAPRPRTSRPPWVRS